MKCGRGLPEHEVEKQQSAAVAIAALPYPATLAGHSTPCTTSQKNIRADPLWCGGNLVKVCVCKKENMRNGATLLMSALAIYPTTAWSKRARRPDIRVVKLVKDRRAGPQVEVRSS